MSYTPLSPEALAAYPVIAHLDQTSVILRISIGLRSRSALLWVVRGGPLEDYGRLVVSSPSDRREPDGTMTEADRTELAGLLDLPEVGPRGAVIVGGTAHYTEFIDRAEGRAPRIYGQVHDWDVV